MRKKIIKRTLIIAVAIIVLIQAVALVKCELLTNKYKSDFETAYKSNTMLPETMDYFKVLECNGKKAEVYYVSRDDSANVLTFENNNGAWIETDCKTIWSTSGSASSVVWPYWWHFVYGGL